MLISLNMRHLIPWRSISEIRLHGRLVTSISIVFLPGFSHLPMDKRNGTAHAVPASFPLMRTRALSRTSPKSSIQSSAFSAGRSMVNV